MCKGTRNQKDYIVITLITEFILRELAKAQ